MLLVPTHVMLACTQGQTLESPVPGSEAKDGNCSHSVLTKRFSLCFGARTSGSDYSHSRSLHGGWRTHCQIVELSCSALLCSAMLCWFVCVATKKAYESFSEPSRLEQFLCDDPHAVPWTSLPFSAGPSAASICQRMAKARWGPVAPSSWLGDVEVAPLHPGQRNISAAKNLAKNAGQGAKAPATNPRCWTLHEAPVAEKAKQMRLRGLDQTPSRSTWCMPQLFPLVRVGHTKGIIPKIVVRINSWPVRGIENTYQRGPQEGPFNSLVLF